MEKRRYKVTLVKYVRDAASCRVDQGRRRFSFYTIVSETGRIAKHRPFASDVDQNAPVRFVRLGIFIFVKLDDINIRAILHISQNVNFRQELETKRPNLLVFYLTNLLVYFISK